MMDSIVKYNKRIDFYMYIGYNGVPRLDGALPIYISLGVILEERR